MDTADGLVYIDRVKAVVQNQLQELDSTARIEDTRYYNHSAIPDFVVSWPGERGERRVYLRDSYRSIIAGDDERYLRKLDPVLLALDSADYKDRGVRAGRRTSLDNSPRALVTDANAVEVLAGERDGENASPIGSLVRANFVRGGKGYVDHDRAELLLGGGSTTDGIEIASALISENFIEDAALRITRTAQLIDFALHGRQEDPEERPTISGKLSLAEIRHLLPWLLTQQAASENTSFWRFIGTMMTFDDLERIRDDLAGIDLSPLIRANSDAWEAKWAYLGVSRSFSNTPENTSPPGRWSFDSGRLGMDIADQRVLIARNGKLIRAREGNSAASWDDLRDPLSAYRLARVVLHGIRRSIAVDALESPDVRGDIEEVANSLEDRYYVTEATLRVPSRSAEDGQSDLVVDFGGSIVRATDSASIRDLTSIAFRVLNYRFPIPEETLNGVLGEPGSGLDAIEAE